MLRQSCRIYGGIFRQDGCNESSIQTGLQPLHRGLSPFSHLSLSQSLTRDATAFSRDLLVARRIETMGRDWKFRNVPTGDVGADGIAR